MSPSVTELELVTLDWVAKMLGLSNDFLTSSPHGGGIILNSASEVAITVAVAAREKMLALMEEQSKHSSNGAQQTVEVGQQPSGPAALMEDVAAWRGTATSKLVMYGTTQTHSIGVKAAMILGLNFRPIEVHAKDAYGLRGDSLRKTLAEDTAKGLVPFMLIATIGTTSSGAIDNLDEIEQVGAYIATAATEKTG